VSEVPRDLAALALTMRKRKDRATEYFNKLAGRFGRVYVPGRSWQALSHALLGLLPPLVIADMGAGEGTLAQLLARTAKKVIAVDNSGKMVEFGAALARDHGFKNIDYRLGDVEDPPVDPNSVDLVVFSQVLHHVPNPPRALSAANKILKPGGRIVILDLASHTFEQARELYAHSWLGFAEVELHQMLKKAGFAKIQSSIVSRESEPPHFQTLLTIAVKL
jgi:ArsR family transcriptional regulator